MAHSYPALLKWVLAGTRGAVSMSFLMFQMWFCQVFKKYKSGEKVQTGTVGTSGCHHLSYKSMRCREINHGIL